MRSEPDENDPFSFDGPEIMSCTGWVSAIPSSLQVFVFETTFDAHNEKLPKSLSVLQFGTSAVTGWWSGAVEWAAWQLVNWHDFERHSIGASTKYLRGVWTLWPRGLNYPLPLWLVNIWFINCKFLLDNSSQMLFRFDTSNAASWPCFHCSLFLTTAARLSGQRARTSHWKQSKRNKSTRAAARSGRSPKRSPTTPFSTSSPHQRVRVTWQKYRCYAEFAPVWVLFASFHFDLCFLCSPRKRRVGKLVLLHCFTWDVFWY